MVPKGPHIAGDLHLRAAPRVHAGYFFFLLPPFLAVFLLPLLRDAILTPLLFPQADVAVPTELSVKS
jgi:hypothetical protein